MIFSTHVTIQIGNRHSHTCQGLCLQKSHACWFFTVQQLKNMSILQRKHDWHSFSSYSGTISIKACNVALHDHDQNREHEILCCDPSFLAEGYLQVIYCITHLIYWTVLYRLQKTFFCKSWHLSIQCFTFQSNKCFSIPVLTVTFSWSLKVWWHIVSSHSHANSMAYSDFVRRWKLGVHDQGWLQYLWFRSLQHLCKLKHYLSVLHAGFVLAFLKFQVLKRPAVVSKCPQMPRI